MCEYCKNQDIENRIHGKPLYIQKTAGYVLDDVIDTAWIMKCSNKDIAGIMIMTQLGTEFIDINYCPMCGRKLGE